MVATEGGTATATTARSQSSSTRGTIGQIDPLHYVLSRLEHVRRKPGGGYMATCPSHHDDKASLSIDQNPEGAVLLKCFAGCSLDDMLGRLGVPKSDLFPLKEIGGSGNGSGNGKDLGTYRGKPITKIYHYRDEQGAPLFEVLRTEAKDFPCRHSDGNGGFAYNLQGVRRVPYRLPEMLAHKDDTLYVVEGEKDVLTLVQLGLQATTNPGGAGKWRDEYNQFFEGRDCVLLPDADEPGRKHMEQVARSLGEVARSVKILELPGLPEKGDVSDWLGPLGHMSSELVRLAESAPALPKPIIKPQGFEVASIGDLLDEPEEDIRWLVDDMLPAGGISMLAARPKGGKSSLSRNLALSVARGRPFLGRETVRGPVIFLALEEKKAEVIRHFRRMGARRGDEIYVHHGAAPKEAVLALQQLVIERKAVLAVIDPIIRFFSDLKSAREYAEIYNRLGVITDLARQTGCHIMCLHHSRKPAMGILPSEDDWTAEVMDSVAFVAAVDTTIMMRRKENQRLIRSEQRYGIDLPPTYLEMDIETGLIRSLGEVDTVNKAHAMRRICEHLATHDGEPQSEKSIIAALGKDTSLEPGALRTLLDEGQVIRSGRGGRGSPYVYELAGSGSAPADRGVVLQYPSGGNASPAPPSWLDDAPDPDPEDIPF